MRIKDAGRSAKEDAGQSSTSRASAGIGTIALLVPVCIVACAAWPGLYQVDSLKQLRQAMTGHYTDTHPPLMALIWAGLLELTGTPASMFGLHIALWALGLLFWALVLCRANLPEGLPLLVLAAFSPTMLFLPGIVLKDVGLAVTLSMAFALAAALVLSQERSPFLLITILILAFYAVGIRWNSFPAVLPLLYLTSLAITRAHGWRRHFAAALACTLCSTLLLGSNLALVFRILPVERDHMIQFLQIHDLAGITVRTHKLLIPAEFQTTRFSVANLEQAYTPTSMDLLYVTPAYLQQASKVNVENVDEIFGKNATGDGVIRITQDPLVLSMLTREWLSAIRENPGAYLRHRTAVFSSLLRLGDEPYPARVPAELKLFYSNSAVTKLSTATLNRLVGWAGGSPLFTGWFWILALAGAILAGAFIRHDPLGKVTIALGVSGLVYLVPYFFVGVAADFRYCYWSIVAATLCAVILGAFGIRTCRDALRNSGSV